MFAQFKGDDAVSPGRDPNNPVPMNKGSNEPMVTLYFINYWVVDNDPESESFGRPAHGVQSHVDQRYYNIPPMGESLTVKRRVADDLQNRLRIYDPIHGWFPGFTTEKSVAEAMRQAFERGELRLEAKNKRSDTILTYQAILERSYQQAAIDSLSDEALEAELKRRKTDIKVSATKLKGDN